MTSPAPAAMNPSPRENADDRCAVFTIDHVGQMSATDPSGTDRSADCWH